MSKEFIESWYRRIPELERDLPIILIEGRVYTPREVYNEVMRGTRLGELMQGKLERLASPNTMTYEDIAELRQVAFERAKKIANKLARDFSIVSISGRIAKGPEEILDALREAAIKYETEKVLKLIRSGR